ncbi:TetR/AcrR family transcriptional regulator [Streptosporangium sp. DT93]|uniref:TetR/AcrR family transcriptional regulator n=1 Tax=Streptosporangium sp. DT93 TaxID=3393428 RepID=UPI003CE717A2
MSIRARRERERAERERLIVTAARELAESQGWDAVTTRRLADRIEYSQPVLYSHFAGKDAIMAAVAAEGFTDLAAELRTARASAADPRRAVADVAATYCAFTERRSALYDAMFAHRAGSSFSGPDAQSPAREVFAELCETLRPHAGDDDPETFAETFWSGLHGLLALVRSGRLGPEEHKRRLELLVGRFSR